MAFLVVEAVREGILLGGVLAVLALGLNLIFGVVDVVWIAYAELVMCGMYTIYWLHAFYGVPLPLGCVAAVLARAGLGLLPHLVITEPVLGSPPVNQRAATGGLRFFLPTSSTPSFCA